MLDIISDHNFKVEEVMLKIWLTNDHIKKLVEMGHTVGLHSYTHPINMQSLSKELDDFIIQSTLELLDNVF